MFSNKLKTSSRVKMLCLNFENILINKILESSFINRYIRYYLLKIFKIKIEGPGIASNCVFKGIKKFSLGKNSYINNECFFDSQNSEIIIGNNCAIGWRSMLITTNHIYLQSKRRAGKIYGKDIIIEDGVWIGAHVLVLPGVRIRAGCVIAAGSVVTKNCTANSLYAGNPAKFIKYLGE